jgi:hypothetical protein
VSGTTQDAVVGVFRAMVIRMDRGMMRDWDGLVGLGDGIAV